ncbi:hypothetical protein [Paraburkholderia domus]|uniref:Uncharacterized protein n=1 Tax=Paraburkholderia domus TaxID=2793075 RepID=A0A9N8QUZ7_9BURK|nr:hypothetical protein [Paraburkholderia domus]MBK5164822.1 hypothetical protein [Burkholderia sp. R-70211]CAE6872336.1 hypothetical protein R70211_01351 [Paraburkholderia domus]
METMPVLAWFHSVAMEAESKPTACALEPRFDALRMDRVPESDGLPVIQFQRYANGGVTPSEETLNRVELVLPTTKATYDKGPKCETGVAPLWLALGGPMVAVRSVMNWYDEGVWKLHLTGAAFPQLMFAVTDPILPRELIGEYLPQWRHDVNRNPLTDAIDEELVEIEMDRFVVLVALFRMSIETGAAFPIMELVVTGLLHKAVYDLFDEWGIARHVKVYPEIMRDHQRDAVAKGFETLENMQASRAAKH